MHVNMVDPQTDQVKQVKVGFSWTVFFFGFWPALFRGDWKWLIVLLIVDCLGIFTYGVLTCVFDIVFAFFYNKLYIQDLIQKGYRPSDDAQKKILLSKGIAVPK